MKQLTRIILLFFFIAAAASGFLFANAYKYWTENKQTFLANAQKLNQLISQKKTEKEQQEFQLNEKGEITKVISTKILDNKGQLIGEFFPAKHFIVYEDEVPDVLIDALVAMEDSRFWKHHGIDARGILRAAYYNLKYRRIVAGGSTLTQQLCKLLFTSQKRTLFRKSLDAIAAVSLERHFTKKEILMMYLNTVYFGHGIYGLESASQFYFHKKSRNLNYAESAMLIGLLGRPNYFSPFKHPEITRKKQYLVLKRMAKLGYINDTSIRPVLKKFWDQYSEAFKSHSASFWKMNINEAPYYIEYIRQLLLQKFREEDLLDKPFIVKTALNLELQKKIQTLTSEYMKNINSGTDSKQVAIIVFNHNNGYVEAMTGGTQFDFQNQLNRAVAMRRQIGSLIKPFIYAEVMESQGLTPQSIVTDKPLSFSFGGHTWNPRNYDNHYAGPITLTEALKASKNSVAVQMLQKIGIKQFTKKIHQIWGVDVLSKNNENLSLALGTLELSPLEVAEGYGLFADTNNMYNPIFLTRIINGDDICIYSNTSRILNSQPVYSSAAVSNILLILSQVLLPGGTGYYAAQKEHFHYPLYAKTGTTRRDHDAWFCGFNQQYTVVVWIGYDKGQKSLHGSGPTLAAPLALKIFKSILE